MCIRSFNKTTDLRTQRERVERETKKRNDQYYNIRLTQLTDENHHSFIHPHTSIVGLRASERERYSYIITTTTTKLG